MKEVLTILSSNTDLLVTSFIVIASIMGALTLFIGKDRRKIFYSEENGSDYMVGGKIRALEKEVGRLKKEVSSDLLKNASKLIDQEVTSYLSENLEKLATEELKETKMLEQKLFIELGNRVNTRIDEFLATQTDTDFAASRREKYLIEQRKGVELELYKTVEQERRSAGLMKSVMINLFVLVNFGLIALYFLNQ